MFVHSSSGSLVALDLGTEWLSCISSRAWQPILSVGESYLLISPLSLLCEGSFDSPPFFMSLP
jgi:hypothetical protein